MMVCKRIGFKIRVCAINKTFIKKSSCLMIPACRIAAELVVRLSWVYEIIGSNPIYSKNESPSELV